MQQKGRVIGVCMLSTHFYPHVGGAEKQIERLGKWLVAHGTPVTVITRQIDGTLRRETRDGINVVRVPGLKGKIPGALSFVVLGTWAVIKHRKHFNVIHSHQIFSPTTIGWLASRILRYPLIINLHRGGPAGDLGKLLRHRFIGHFRLNVLKQDAELFIAISREIEAELHEQGVPDHKIQIQANAVDPLLFHPVSSERQAELRQTLGLPVEGSLVCFVGRLAEEKGVDVLLEAWEQVPAPAYLVIVGAGNLAGPLQARAKERLDGRVIFTGLRENTSDYLQASHAWVLPSFTEGLPLSLLEAMACGLPVVVTPVGAVPEIVISGENGLIVPVSDPNTLAKALCTAISGTAEVQTMGLQARETVLKHYSLDKVAESYYQLYKQIV